MPTARRRTVARSPVADVGCTSITSTPSSWLNGTASPLALRSSMRMPGLKLNVGLVEPGDIANVIRRSTSSCTPGRTTMSPAIFSTSGNPGSLSTSSCTARQCARTSRSSTPCSPAHATPAAPATASATADPRRRPRDVPSARTCAVEANATNAAANRTKAPRWTAIWPSTSRGTMSDAQPTCADSGDSGAYRYAGAVPYAQTCRARTANAATITTRRLPTTAPSRSTKAIQHARIGKLSSRTKAVCPTGSTGSPNHQPASRANHAASCTSTPIRRIGTQATQSTPVSRPTSKVRFPTGRLSTTSAILSRTLRAPMSNARNAAAATKTQST